MSQLFSVGEKKYNIPDERINDFLEKYPDAVKIKSVKYRVGDKNYTIPQSIEGDFLRKNPNAKSVSAAPAPKDAGDLDKELDAVVGAISTFESGDVSTRHNNPGNIQYSDSVAQRYGAKIGEEYVDDFGASRNHAFFEDPASGLLALYDVAGDLWEKSGKDPRKFAEVYSGSSDSTVINNYTNEIKSNLAQIEIDSAGEREQPDKILDAEIERIESGGEGETQMPAPFFDPNNLAASGYFDPSAPPPTMMNVESFEDVGVNVPDWGSSPIFDVGGVGQRLKPVTDATMASYYEALGDRAPAVFIPGTPENLAYTELSHQKEIYDKFGTITGNFKRSINKAVGGAPIIGGYTNELTGMNEWGLSPGASQYFNEHISPGLRILGANKIGTEDILGLGQIVTQFAGVGLLSSSGLAMTSGGRLILTAAQSGGWKARTAARVGKSILDFNLHNVLEYHPGDKEYGGEYGGDFEEGLLNALKERLSKVPESSLHGLLFGVSGSFKGAIPSYGSLFGVGYYTGYTGTEGTEEEKKKEALKSGVLLTMMHYFNTLAMPEAKMKAKELAEKVYQIDELPVRVSLELMKQAESAYKKPSKESSLKTAREIAKEKTGEEATGEKKDTYEPSRKTEIELEGKTNVEEIATERGKLQKESNDLFKKWEVLRESGNTKEADIVEARIQSLQAEIKAFDAFIPSGVASAEKRSPRGKIVEKAEAGEIISPERVDSRGNIIEPGVPGDIVLPFGGKGAKSEVKTKEQVREETERKLLTEGKGISSEEITTGSQVRITGIEKHGGKVANVLGVKTNGVVRTHIPGVGKRNFKMEDVELVPRAMPGELLKDPVELKSGEEKIIVGVAPYRNEPVKNSREAQKIRNKNKVKIALEQYKNIAKLVGTEVSETKNVIGGYTDASGRFVREVSHIVVLKDPSKSKEFSAAVGALSPDYQHSVIKAKASNKGKHTEVQISFNSKAEAERALKSIEKNNENYSFDDATNTVYIIGERGETFKNQIRNTGNEISKQGIPFKWKGQRVESELIGGDKSSGGETYGQVLRGARDRAVAEGRHDEALLYSKALTEHSRAKRLSRGGVGDEVSKDAKEKRKLASEIIQTAEKEGRPLTQIEKDRVRTLTREGFSYPNKEVSEKSKLYSEKNKDELGLEDYKESERVDISINNSRKIAEEYDKLKKDNSSNPEVKDAYDAMIKEVGEQYDFLIKQGYKIEWWTENGKPDGKPKTDKNGKETQPYKSSIEMMNDILLKKRVKIYTGGEDHPLLGVASKDSKGVTANLKFRAVHDILAHAGKGNEFGARGEENAWVEHMKLFSKDAQRALTTETRGQNSWTNYNSNMFDVDGYRGDKSHPRYLPPSERPFAEQKADLLPDHIVYGKPKHVVAEPVKSHEFLATYPSRTWAEIQEMAREFGIPLHTSRGKYKTKARLVDEIIQYSKKGTIPERVALKPGRKIESKQEKGYVKPSGEKMPYEMTEAEYKKHMKSQGKKVKSGDHKKEVESAVTFGRKVPEKVLRKYPDLKAKSELASKRRVSSKSPVIKKALGKGDKASFGKSLKKAYKLIQKNYEHHRNALNELSKEYSDAHGRKVNISLLRKTDPRISRRFRALEDANRALTEIETEARRGGVELNVEVLPGLNLLIKALRNRTKKRLGKVESSAYQYLIQEHDALYKSWVAGGRKDKQIEARLEELVPEINRMEGIANKEPMTVKELEDFTSTLDGGEVRRKALARIHIKQKEIAEKIGAEDPNFRELKKEVSGKESLKDFTPQEMLDFESSLTKLVESPKENQVREGMVRSTVSGALRIIKKPLKFFISAEKRFNTNTSKDMYRRIASAQQRSARINGQLTEAFKRLGVFKLSKKKAIELSDKVERNETPEIRQLFDQIYNMAEAVGIEMPGRIEVYLPRFLSRRISEKIFLETSELNRIIEKKKQGSESGSEAAFTEADAILLIRNRIKNKKLAKETSTALDKMIESGVASNYAEALIMLNKFMYRDAYSPFANFEMSRKLGFPKEYYERDFRVIISRYIYGASKRIAEAEYFGVKGEIAQRIVKESRLNKDESEPTILWDSYRAFTGTIRRDPARTWGKTPTKFMNWLTQWTILNKIGFGLSQIPNLTQPLISTMPKLGVFTTIKGGGKVLSAKRRRMIRESGVNSLSHDMLFGGFHQTSGLLSRAVDRTLTINMFSPINTWNAYLSASTADAYLTKLYKMKNSRFKNKREYAENKLKRLGFSPNKKPTKDQRLEFMFRMSTDLNVLKNIAKEPITANDPRFANLWVLKKFGYKQAKQVKDTIVEEWNDSRGAGKITRPIRYMLTLGALGVLGGEFVHWSRSAIKEGISGSSDYDPEEESSMANKFITRISEVGSIGVMTDVSNSLLLSEYSDDDWREFAGQMDFTFTPVIMQDMEKLLGTVYRFGADAEMYGVANAFNRKRGEIFNSVFSGTIMREFSKRLQAKEVSSAKWGVKMSREISSIRDMMLDGKHEEAMKRLIAWNKNHKDYKLPLDVFNLDSIKRHYIYHSSKKKPLGMARYYMSGISKYEKEIFIKSLNEKEKIEFAQQMSAWRSRFGN